MKARKPMRRLQFRAEAILDITANTVDVEKVEAYVNRSPVWKAKAVLYKNRSRSTQKLVLLGTYQARGANQEDPSERFSDALQEQGFKNTKADIWVDPRHSKVIDVESNRST